MNTLKLKEFRERAKMSQLKVANIFNMTQQAYSCWETGKSFPNPNQIKELCKIFKCTPNDLFGFRGVHAVTSDELL